LKNAAEAIRSFQKQHVDLASVAQLEMFLPQDVDLAGLNEAAAFVADLKLQCFWETPAESAEKAIALIARAKQPTFGYKLRTGGVTADAFPSSIQIARGDPVFDQASCADEIHRRPASSDPTISR